MKKDTKIPGFVPGMDINNLPWWLKMKPVQATDEPASRSEPEPAELTLQSRCFLWHWNNYPEERGMLYHVQNKARNAIEGNKFKALGVVRGVSDLNYVLPGGRSIYIEMKTSTGTQSPAQREWQLKVEARGHTYVIIRSENEFQNLVFALVGAPQKQKS